MTSTNLRHKSSFIPVMKKGFKKLLPNIILTGIASFLAAILGVIFYTMQYITYPTDDLDYSLLFGANNFDFTEEATILLCILTAICGFFSLTSSSRLFKEIYSKRACDHYFATPVKREVTFFASYSVGAIVNLAFTVLPTMLFIISIKASATPKVNYTIDMVAFLKAAAIIILSLISIYTAFIMCAVMSGKRLHYLILSLVCLICPAIIAQGVVSRINNIWGLALDTVKACTISPVINTVHTMNMDYNENIIAYIIIPAIEIAGMLFVGLRLFKDRKAEVAEVSLTGRVMPYVLLSVFVLSGFMGVQASLEYIKTIIVGVVFSAIACLLFSLILYKKAFTKRIGAVTAIVCTLSIAFVLAVYLPSYNSYVKYIPDADNIESVEINSVYGDNYSIYTSYVYNPSLEKVLVFEDKDCIADVIKLHEKIVDDITMTASKKNSDTDIYDSPFYSYKYDHYENTCDFQIVYKLKNGKAVKRTYSVISSRIKEEGLAVMRHEEALRQMEPFSVDNILFAIYREYDNDYNLKNERIVPADKCDELRESLFRDCLEYNDNIYTREYGGILTEGVDYRLPSVPDPKGELIFYYYDPEETPEDIEKKLKEKSPEELYKICDGVYTREERLMAYVLNSYTNIYPGQKHIENFLNINK